MTLRRDSRGTCEINWAESHGAGIWQHGGVESNKYEVKAYLWPCAQFFSGLKQPNIIINIPSSKDCLIAIHCSLSAWTRNFIK